MTRSLAPVQVAFDPPTSPSRKAINLGVAKPGTAKLRGDGE